MTEEQYLRIVRPLRALMDAWCEDRPPTAAEQASASIGSQALAELAAEAHLPIEVAFKK
jgi:hypothetical protein